MADPNPKSPDTDTKPKSNIFASPLKGKSTADEKKLVLKKRVRRKAFIRLIIAAIFLGVYSFYFLYPQLSDYLNFDNEIKGLEEQIETTDVKLAGDRDTRDLHKADYEEEFKEEQKIINTVFPETTDKLGVIRLMENFATHLSTAYPPFDFNAISFREAEKMDGYTMLPFQTSVHASRTNFERFLGLINLSGSIDPESPDHIRLMEISNISLNDRGFDKKTGEHLGLDLNFQLKAYSR